MSTIQKLETMSDTEFNIFLTSLPQRVQFLVRSGMANWREVLPEWYELSFTKPENHCKKLQ